MLKPISQVVTLALSLVVPSDFLVAKNVWDCLLIQDSVDDLALLRRIEFGSNRFKYQISRIHNDCLLLRCWCCTPVCASLIHLVDPIADPRITAS